MAQKYISRSRRGSRRIGPGKNTSSAGDPGEGGGDGSEASESKPSLGSDFERGILPGVAGSG